MLSTLLDEIEERLRQIVREEIQAALLEMNNPTESKIESKTKSKITTKVDFPELLTARQVAELLFIDVQRVYELTRQRTKYNFPAIVIGERSYRYSKQAMMDWIKR